MVGSAANAQGSAILPLIDAELAKLFEDRNILLTDGGLITFTGTQLQFTENLNIVLNQKISGAAPQVISLGSSNVNFSASGRMWYAVIDRGAGTAVQTTDATTLPAVTSANQEVFLIAKRVDAGDGTQRIYWRNGMGQNAGQTLRLGASGSGTGGSGVGSDLTSLQYRAEFIDTFDDGPTSSLSAVDVTSAHTDSAAYNAAKALYQLNYDASKTIAAGTTTTNINISANASFTVKTGDMVIYGSQARRITAVSTQASFTVEAFDVAPTLAGQVTISQAVHTKDIYNFAVDGNSLASAFGATTFSEIMVDYEDTSTVGDNIYDINTAPVVAYDASYNGTSWTNWAVRATLETDTWQSLALTGAGTALYLRFYANKTSGSGSVNILRYVAKVQKSVSASTGGVNWSAYGTSDNSTTPINCTISVSGGKTTLTLTGGNTYAVGVNSTQAYGAIDVFVNGAMFPRFVSGSVPSGDGYYTEVSPTVIQLDKDYSSQQLEILVISRTSIIDSNTQNTSNISALQEASLNGFQGFVNQATLLTATTSAGTPVAGSFYSSIIGRASIVDLSQDLKPRMGVERIMTQQIGEVQEEQGPSGERVWSFTNDVSKQVRFVGNWASSADTAGEGVVSGTVANNDYVEITFYGTGLNVLRNSSGPPAISYAVDGGSLTAVTIAAGETNIIGVRNYAPNVVQPIVSGLTLGIHTVKLLSTSSAAFKVYGFEILNESTSLKITPGISYLSGKKLISSALTTVAPDSSFESGTLGSGGGRVVVYQKADGTIAKAVTPTGGQANLSSANHANEEVVRVYMPREFGSGLSGGANDFSGSGLTTSNGDAGYTLDDGTTNLIGRTVRNSVSTLTEGGIQFGANGAYLIFTFVGTGLDVIRQDDGTGTDNYQYYVDGTSIGNVNASSTATGKSIEKVVSGLPYGTHTVKLIRNSAGFSSRAIYKFIVYQPKKPSIPSGAVELADYNVMATFVANSTAGVETVATGVLRKHVAVRESIFVNGWSVHALDVVNYLGGWETISTAASGNYVQFSFFGTGFEMRGVANTTQTANTSVTLNGLAATTGNFPSLVSSVYGGFTFSAGTLSQAASNTIGSGMRISGLPLGLYTVRFTTNTAAALVIDTIDVITPIHSHKSNLFADLQKTLPVGSNAISDNRKITPVKDALPARKAWSQCVGIASNPTTTVGSFVPVPDMECDIKLSEAGAIQIDASIHISNSTVSSGMDIRIYVDGINVVERGINQDGSQANGANVISIPGFIVPVGAGHHIIQMYWQTSNTATANGGKRHITVREL